jgi:hypothetical protein
MKKSSLIIFVLLFAFVLLPKIVFAQVNPLNLSANAKSAINNLAKDILTQGYNPRITDIKTQLDPTDYATVKSIKILPTNPLFIFKYAWNETRVFLTFDTKEKAHLMLVNDNEKTLEALLTLEASIKTKNPVLKQIYVNISAALLDSVGGDFDYVSRNIDSVDKDEAYKFSEIYLKHQILLQQEEDQLSESDFIKIESVRVKHLASLGHIVASRDKTPDVIAKELANAISPQTGLNYKDLVGAAILRDLEYSAEGSDVVVLESAQNSLIKSFQSKLSKLTKKERLDEITRYASFIHGNPIRQFQIYNQISESFTSAEMNILTSGLKDKAAQNFKKHLDGLTNASTQKQFVETIFSEYPIDLRVLFYAQIQLENPKVLAAATPQEISPQKEARLNNLQGVKTILSNQICQNFGGNPDKLANTRFYSQSIKNPDVVDIKVAQFVLDSIQNCSTKSDAGVKLATDLQTAITKDFTKEAKTTPVTGNLPTKSQAETILKEEGVTVAPGDEQIVAELIEQETKQIEEEATVPETIVEKVVAIEEPIQEEITEKEEQIIEEIIVAVESGETSPLIEELPEEVQQEIINEVKIIVASTPAPTAIATPLPTAIPTTAPTIVPTIIPTAVPTSAPTIAPLPTEEPTLIETVQEVVVEVAPPAPQP